MNEIQITPTPKSLRVSDEIAVIPAEIAAAAGFETVGRVFAEYAREKNGLEFAPGAGGISILPDAALTCEAYRIVCTAGGIKVSASAAKGAHNAMAALLQLISNAEGKLSCPCLEIEDAPDSSYRGLMMDTARHPHSIDLLKKYIDLCYFSRASHIQIHFTDDQNFTLILPWLPGLKGNTYTREDLKELADYAFDRGITVVPEVDMPGHSTCLTKAYPEIFGSTRIMSASECTFEALRKIFTYVHEVFPNSPLIHIGGDEAEITDWELCPASREYMAANGISSIHEMYAEYVRRVTEIIFDLGCTPVVWEGFSKEYNDRISKDVIVIAWESLYQPAYELARDGFRLINCSWEPLYIVTGDKYWSTDDIGRWNIRFWKNWFHRSLAYPDGFTLPKGEANILGGQICAWGDRICGAEDPEALLAEEFRLVSERLPVLCERTWNTD